VVFALVFLMEAALGVVLVETQGGALMLQAVAEQVVTLAMAEQVLLAAEQVLLVPAEQVAEVGPASAPRQAVAALGFWGKAQTALRSVGAALVVQVLRVELVAFTVAAADQAVLVPVRARGVEAQSALSGPAQLVASRRQTRGIFNQEQT
jgi:hypothetical protein